MDNKEYISYLNSLHNYNAQNPNSYGEKNVDNPFFDDVMVKVGLGNYILDNLNGEQPHVIILTGHAGDGKTSIMYQVLSDLGIAFNPEEKISDYILPSGKICKCIKDFSELADDEKVKVLAEVVQMPDNDAFAFMVANTGPLINTFGELFDEHTAERAKIDLIEVMDRNTGEIHEIMGYRICVINVATVDNTYFAVEFLKKVVQDKLWEKCEGCSKREFCHIVRNRDLIVSNIEKVSEFINMHYVWLTEHGKRLTIRSMTEQIAYMFTGGLNCSEVIQMDSYMYLFTNLFFGCIGTRINPKAANILAIKEAQTCGYDSRRLRLDEALLINHEFNKMFTAEMVTIIEDAEKKNANVSGWAEFLHRAYFFTNIETDENIVSMNFEDIFSKHFRRYLTLCNRTASPDKSDTSLICDALSMIYLGITNSDRYIYLTLSRESGIAQNVQLITGSLETRKIKLVPRPAKDNLFNQNSNRSVLKLQVNEKILKSEITLPLLNYFEELRNGIISTNVDPQLSHGIESLKAELVELVNNAEDEFFEMTILRNDGIKTVGLEFTEDMKLRAT